MRRRAALALGAAVWFGAVALGAAAADALDEPFVSVDPQHPDWSLALDIARNNVGIAAMLASGFVTLGLLTVPTGIASGMLFGNLLAQAVEVAGPVTVLQTVGTHGILELPAIAAACGIGCIPLVAIVRRAVLGSVAVPCTTRTVVRAACDALALFAVVVVGLGIAALVEVWVTSLW